MNSEVLDPDNDLNALRGSSWPAFVRCFLNTLGGPAGAAASAWSEVEQSRINERIAALFALEREKYREMVETLLEVEKRIDQTDEKVKERIKSPEYLALVKRCFKDWAGAESKDKRTYIRNLLVNAAKTDVTKDDTLRMFIRWIDEYSDLHFAVIKVVYRKRGVTRAGIWTEIGSARPREDSSDADLFKLLIHDLSVGHIIRQSRETDGYGQFYKQPKARSAGTSVLTSAFEDSKLYELTALGKDFVHYVMTDEVAKINA